MAPHPGPLPRVERECRCGRTSFFQNQAGRLRGRLFLAWLSHARDQAEEQRSLLANEDRGQPAARRAGEPDVAPRGLESFPRLGTCVEAKRREMVGGTNPEGAVLSASCRPFRAWRFLAPVPRGFTPGCHIPGLQPCRVGDRCSASATTRLRAGFGAARQRGSAVGEGFQSAADFIAPAPSGPAGCG